jgi:hypothetical protein
MLGWLTKVRFLGSFDDFNSTQQHDLFSWSLSDVFNVQSGRNGFVNRELERVFDMHCNPSALVSSHLIQLKEKNNASEYSYRNPAEGQDGNNPLGFREAPISVPVAAGS